MPEGVSPLGPVADASEAFAKCLTAIPEILIDIEASLSVIALYCEKRGITDGIITNDELDGGEKHDGPSPN
jgi:hypothetical protein